MFGVSIACNPLIGICDTSLPRVVCSCVGRGSSGGAIVEWTQLDVLSSLLALGTSITSIFSPVPPSSITCSIALSLASAIATFLFAARIAMALSCCACSCSRIRASSASRVLRSCSLSATSLSYSALSRATAASASALILPALLELDGPVLETDLLRRE